MVNVESKNYSRLISTLSIPSMPQSKIQPSLHLFDPPPPIKLIEPPLPIRVTKLSALHDFHREILVRPYSQRH